MNWFARILDMVGLLPRESIFYIGGSDILPPPLKGQEELDALQQLEEGSEEAKSLLIEHNLRLVVYIARRFENTGIPLEDLISIGTIGLIKSIGTYRRDKNIKLATYWLLSTSRYIWHSDSSKCLETQTLFWFIFSRNFAKNT